MQSRRLYFLITSGITFSTLLVWMAWGALEVPKSSNIFNHKKHVQEIGLACDHCHYSARTSEKAADLVIAKMEVCMGCHDRTTAPQECRYCHLNPDKPEPYVNPKREIFFSHKSHLERKIECQKCHTGVDKAVVLSSANMPDMASCLECHNGVKAPSDCALCHLNPRQAQSMIHPANWLQIHKYRANQSEVYCASCHQGQDLCLACHRGDNYTGTIHPLNFKFTHGLEAKGKTFQCASCHEVQSFCIACHQQELRMPLDHVGSNWATRGGDERQNLHAEAAQRDLERCSVCHNQTSPSCVRCHG